jgi:hypothetical protein
LQNCIDQQIGYDGSAIGITQCNRTGTFGMWHHTHYVSGSVADASNVTAGSVGASFFADGSIGFAVSKQHLVIGLKLIEQLFGPMVATLTVCNRDLVNLSYRIAKKGIAAYKLLL